MPVKRQPDYLIIAIVASLVLGGLVMVYSSSAIIAAERYDDSYYFLKRQSLWALIGFLVMLFVMRIDYRRLAGWSYPIYIATIAILLIVLFSSMGHSVNGAQRWIRLGPLAFQPSEFASAP